MSEWKSVVSLPPAGLLVLVVGRYHDGVALGCCDEKGYWDVQPYRLPRYGCNAEGITHWAYVRVPEQAA